jgi:hypothetical protein
VIKNHFLGFIVIKMQKSTIFRCDKICIFLKQFREKDLNWWKKNTKNLEYVGMDKWGEICQKILDAMDCKEDDESLVGSAIWNSLFKGVEHV